MPPVTLRPTTEPELPFVLAAEGAAEALPFILPWTQAQHVAALVDRDLAHRLVIEAAGGQPVGFVLLAGLSSPHACVEFRRIVIRVPGRGYGCAATRAVKAWAFGELGAHRLWLDVKAANRRARSLYASEGFREEGTLRECLRAAEGGYESLVVMGLLATEVTPEA